MNLKLRFFMLALLCTMLNVAWGQDKYYVAGTWTNWQDNKIEMTKNDDGTYTLANQELEAEARFKIIKVVDGSDPVWCGGTADPGTYSWVTIDNHTNIDLIVNGGEDFYFNIAGTWTITVDPTGDTPKLTVDGWPEWEYYLKGDFNEWGIDNTYKFSKNESTGKYTLNKPIALDQKFKIYGVRGSEGKWIGSDCDGTEFWVVEGLYNKDLGLASPGKDFIMKLSNDYYWSLEFDPTNKKIVLRMPIPFTLTINEAATDGKGNYYATMGNIGIGNFVVPDGVTAYTVQVNENGKIQMEDYDPNTQGKVVIPGSEAYLLKSSTSGEYVFNPATEDDGEAITLGTNMLYPAVNGDDDKVHVPGMTDSDYLFYKLSLNSSSTANSVGFYWGDEDKANNKVAVGGPFHSINEKTAFLAVPKESGSTPVEAILINFDDDADGILGVSTTEQGSNEAYTLTGVRVKGNLPKGIYIINGRKQVVR